MERIENRMVNEAAWHEMESDFYCKPDLNGAGWKNVTDGTFVPEESAFDYALDQCVKDEPWRLRGVEWTQEFKEMLVEWFYSDRNWVHEDGKKENP